MAFHSQSQKSDEPDRNGMLEKAQDSLLRACVLEPWNTSYLSRYVVLDPEVAPLFKARIEKIKARNI
jgi:hypothetical protein